MLDQLRSKGRLRSTAAPFGMLAVLATFVSGCVVNGQSQFGDRIDLCEFSGPDFRQLESRLHREVTSGDKISKLVSKIVWNTTHRLEETDLVDVDNHANHVDKYNKHFPTDNPALQPYPDGLAVFHYQLCEKQNQNSDQWSLFIRADKRRRIDQFGIVLTYIDQNFAARNEPLNHRRYLVATDSFSTLAGNNRKPVTMALDSLMNDRGLSAQQLIDEIIVAGFVGKPTRLTEVGIAATSGTTVLIHEFTFPDPLDITDPKVNGELVYYRFGGFLHPDFKWRFVVSEDLDTGAIVGIE